MDLFIAESSIGRHNLCTKELDVKLLSFTFTTTFHSLTTPVTNLCEQTTLSVSMPKVLKIGEVKLEESFIHDYGKDIIKLIKDLYDKEGDGCHIFLGQDNDRNGHVMAGLLFHHLQNIGIKEEYIIRVPLMTNGYDYNSIIIGMSSFFNEAEMIGIVETERKEQEMMNTKTRVSFGSAGYRNMAALAHIHDRLRERNPMVEVLRKKTCLATYITKWLLKEK